MGLAVTQIQKARPQKRPFYVRLRESIDAIDLPQKDIAALLDIAPSTLETWLAPPSKSWHREPHRLMQIGAIRVLLGSRTKRDSLSGHPERQNATASKWRVTYADGRTEVLVNLRKWCRERNALHAYAVLLHGGAHDGMTAERTKS